jgi:hypothetical protein
MICNCPEGKCRVRMSVYGEERGASLEVWNACRRYQSQVEAGEEPEPIKLPSGPRIVLINGVATEFPESDLPLLDQVKAYLGAQPTSASTATATRGTCTHLGAATGETQECRTCAGSVRIKLFECALHGQCTLYKPLCQIHCCQTCPDYAARVV